MCGLVGVINPNLTSEIALKRLKISQSLISHRGEDSQETYFNKLNNLFIAFNRLAIVDLDQRSNQPMKYTYKNKSIIGMMNGEIYNYKELKRELINDGYAFNTDSDTEVFLAFILARGINSLNKINGIFGAFIFDEFNKKLFLIRDQIGVKPIYYIKNNPMYNFVFASEIKAFKPFIDLRPSTKELSEFCCFGETSSTRTIYENIYQIEPGHYLELSLNEQKKLKNVQYFSLIELYNNNSNKESTFLENTNSFHNNLVEHINMQLNIDVAFGVEFSGGLDSSLLTSLLKNRENISTYSAVIPDFDRSEEYWQQKVTNHLQIRNKKIILESNFYKEESLSKLIYSNDAPLQHPNFLPCFYLCNQAKKDKIKVLISGDGADEFFSGYKWLSEDLKYKKESQIIEDSAYNNIESIKNLFRLNSINLDKRIEYISQLDTERVSNPNLLKAHIYMQRFYLQKWLHRQDRTGMSNGIEIRVPFCDFSLIKLYLGAKLNSLKDISGSKKDLKKIAENYLPKDIIYRQKIGFPLPLEDLFSHKGILNNISYLLKNKKFISFPDILNIDFAAKIANSHLNKKSKNGRLLWTIYNTELWLRSLFD